MAPLVGHVVKNKYRLLRRIGDGGMGTVFEARHETLGTTVALKFLHLEFTRREGLVQRFLQEARVAAQIQSAHVVRVIDVDQTDDAQVFIVLEFLEGRTLQTHYEELYRGGQRLPYADALDYATQILEGVEAAHRVGVVHRDLKPDNVMITLDGKGGSVLKLLDFGIAKFRAVGSPGLTKPGVMMGTPEYMAPEQASSADAVDGRADIFSLGVMVFEMLAGQRPVAGDDPHVIAAAYLGGRILDLRTLVPGVAPGIAVAVHKAMAALAADRYATVAEFRDAIEVVAGLRAPPASRARGGSIGLIPPPRDSTPRTQADLQGFLGSPLAASGRTPKTWPPEAGTGADAPLSGTVIDPVSNSLSSRTIPEPNDLPDAARVGSFPLPKTASGGVTGPMGPLPGSPIAYPVFPAARPEGRRRRRPRSPITMVLVIAAICAGLVTAGIYAFSRPKDDDLVTAKRTPEAPPRLAPVAPLGGGAASVAPSPPVQPPPDVSPPVKPLRPGPPIPKPSSVPVAPSTPLQPGPAPLVIPSAFPFPNPFQPAPAPQPAPQSGG